MILDSKQTLRALLLACALALLLAAPAAAATRAAAVTPCWKKLVNDWYDGQINHLYPIPCYQQAINHLPASIEVYSSAIEDIRRARAIAIAHAKNPNAPLPAVVNSDTTAGPVPSAIENSSSGGATTFPLPLIILGGLAIFLLAAGAIGVIIRRRQGDDDTGSGPTPG